MTNTVAVPANRRAQIDTAVVALTVLLLGGLGIALLRNSAGYPIAAICACALSEVGRASWSARATLAVDADGVTVGGPGRPGFLPWSSISWVGLTRRGLIIEGDGGRHVLFDLSPEQAFEALQASTPFRAAGVPIEVSHDLARRAILAVFMLTSACLFGLVAFASFSDDLSHAEMIASLVTAIPLGVCAGVVGGWAAMSPYKVSVGPTSTQFIALARRHTSRSTPAKPTSATSISQRIIGVPPGERLVVTSGSRAWKGPIGAPGTFVSVAERISELTGPTDQAQTRSTNS